MPHLVHSRVPVGASRSPSPSPLSTPTIPRPITQSSQSPKHAINRKAWPQFPPPQSLSDDTSQLHLTLRSLPSHSPSPSPSPLLSRQSSSGAATPDDDNSVPISATSSSFDLRTASLTPSPSELLFTDKSRFKKKNRVSAASLTSLLSSGHEDKRGRKERKLTEKFLKHEQALQELRTADRRRAYFREASHRQELTFRPEVRAHPFFFHFLQISVPSNLSAVDIDDPFRTFSRPIFVMALFNSRQHCRYNYLAASRLTLCTIGMASQSASCAVSENERERAMQTRTHPGAVFCGA